MGPNKETTYQRLKRENQELRNKLIILVNDPDSAAALEIKSEVTLISNIENAIWKGNASGTKFEGFIKSIIYQ